MSSSARRIPSLDGLRAFSIALVLLSHLAGTDHFALRAGAFREYGDLGYLGVRVFFVISGFLITSLLLAEHRKTETISLREFYVRRVFRIFPAFYTYLIVIVALSATGQLTLMDGDVAHATTYTTNYHYHRSWHLGHVWSLSVEEQFYLVWPLAMLWLGRKRGMMAAAAVIAAGPFLRVAAWFVFPDLRDDVIMESFPTVADALATGCLLAGARDWLWRRGWYRRFLQSWTFVLVPCLVLLFNMPHRVSFDYTLGITFMNLGIALCIDRVIRLPDGVTGRVLNWGPIAWVGTLSYSLYLWQEPFLNPHSNHPFASFPLNLAVAFALAVASYYLVEKAALRLRDRVLHRNAGTERAVRA